MGKHMGWTRIIVCHGAHVITSVQTHLICCLTCFLHGVVVHRCVVLTRCGHGCVMPTRCGTLTRCGTPTRCGHGCVTLTRCGTPTRCGHRCGTLTRCGMLTRLTASMPLTSTCLPTTLYNQFTCVARITCIVQGQPTNLFNRLQGINTVGVDLKPWFALRHNPQLRFNLSQIYKSSVSRLN